jgi:hypothetical protein
MKMLNKLRIALAATILALTAVSTAESARAAGGGSHEDKLAFGDQVGLP